MGLFILCLFLLVLGLIAVTVIRRKCLAKSAFYATSNTNDRYSTQEDDWKLGATISRVTGWIFIGLAILLFILDCTVVVSTKNVGVETLFGKPTGALSNGLHVINPFVNVTEMDAAVQTDSYTQGPAANRIGDCITVRIAYQATACADVSIRWRITERAAPELFKNYRTFDHVRDSLVTRELNSSMNAIFENYDPLALNPDGTSAATSLASLSAQVATLLKKEIGDQVELQNPSVIISVLHFQPAVQTRIDALYTQIGDTRVAQQQLLTNQAQAKANQALAASLSNDPMVLVSRCLDLIAKGFNPPAGFSCWPGAGSSVVIPASNK